MLIDLLRIIAIHALLWLACIVSALLVNARASLWRVLERSLIALVLLAFTACASTTFSHNGQKILVTQANITGLVVTKDGELRADRIDHSTPTRAGGAAAGTWWAGITSTIAAWFAGKPL